MPYLLTIGNKNYSSWSLRVWLTMRHFNIPFEEKLLPFQNTGLEVQATYLKYSPQGKMPCLHHHLDDDNDDEKNKIIVWDSLAIIEYLAEQHPEIPIWPSLPTSPRTLPLARTARAFARSATCEMHSSFPSLRDHMSQHISLRISFPISTMPPDLIRELKRINQLWSEGLVRFGGPWLVGKEVCVADLFWLPVAGRLRTFGVIGGWEGEGKGEGTSGEEETKEEKKAGQELFSPLATAYAKRLLTLPAFKEWERAAWQEDFGNAWKEEDCIRGRRILADLRKTRGKGEKPSA